MPELTRLANGVRIVSESTANVGTVALGVWLNNGSRYQTPLENGYAHFLEHLLFKATAQHSGAELAQRFEMMGGRINAYTGRELTLFHGYVPTSNWRELLSHFCDMIRDPRFTENDVRLERDIVLQEMAAVKDAPDEVLEEAAIHAIWGPHEMAWPILGSEHIIEQATEADVRRYLAQVMTGERVWITAVGDLEHSELVDACRVFEALTSAPLPRVTAPSYSQRDIVMHEQYTQVTMQWSMPLPPINDPTHYALLVGNHLLGGGTSSRLFQEIREERGLVYDIHSEIDLYMDCGLWTIHTSCEPDHAAECREAVEGAIDRLSFRGPKAQEVQISRQFVRANLVLERTNLESAMERLSRDWIYFGKPRTQAEILERIDRVREEDIAMALQDCWRQRSFALLEA